MITEDIRNWMHSQLWYQVPISISVIDQDFKIVEANPRFTQDYGDWHGRFCYEVYKGACERCTDCAATKTFTDGLVRDREEQGVVRNGKQTYYLVHMVPLIGPDSKIPYIVEMSTDITATKLLEQEKVFAIFGPVGDHPHSGVQAYLNDLGVPDLFIVGGAHTWGANPEEFPWSVGGVPDYRTEGSFFGQYISDNLPGKKVAVLWENQHLGWDGLAGVKAGLDPEKNELVSEQSYEATAVDIRSQIINMKDAGAEVVVLYSTPGFTAQAIKQADRMDWYPQFLASYVNSDPILFQFVSAELAEGLISFNAFKIPDDTDDPAIAQHHQIMQDYGGPSPGVFTLFAQLIAEVMVEALSRTCDDLTREGLMDAVESITDYRSDLLLEGVTVTLSDTDHWTLQSGPMERVVVENGKGRWEYFGPVYTFD